MSDTLPSRPTRAPASPSSARGKGTTPTIDPWPFLAALRRRLLPAVILSILVGGAAGAAVWFFLPPEHDTATRVLHVAAAPQFIVGEVQQRTDFDTFKQTQVALIRSRLVLTAALRAPKVAASDWIKRTPEPLEHLEREVKVSFPASSEIMHISLCGPSEQIPTLILLVDAIADAYLSEIVGKDQQRLLKRHEQLREIATRYEKKVQAIRKSMKDLREKGGAEKNRLLMQRLAEDDLNTARQELQKFRAEIRVLKVQIEQTEKNKGRGKLVIEEEREQEAEGITLALAADTRLVTLKSEAKSLDALIKREAEKSPQGLKAPIVQPMLRELREKKAEITRREDAIRTETPTSPKQERKDNAAVGVTGMRQRLAQLEGLEKLTIKDIQRLNREASPSNRLDINLEDFNKELAEADAMRASLSKKAELLLIESLAPPRVTRLDQEAVITSPDERMRKIKFAGMASAGAIGLGLVLLAIGFMNLRKA